MHFFNRDSLAKIEQEFKLQNVRIIQRSIVYLM